MNKILDCHGGSNYKIPHLGKEKLEREGRLPLVLKVTETAWDFWTVATAVISTAVVIVTVNVTVTMLIVLGSTELSTGNST